MWGKDHFGDCGMLEKHHIFGGPFRDKSEYYGLTVFLTVENHREGKYAAHRCCATADCLKRYGQEKVMREQGWTVERFIREFGKNYLEEDELAEIEAEREWIKEENPSAQCEHWAPPLLGEARGRSKTEPETKGRATSSAPDGAPSPRGKAFQSAIKITVEVMPF